MNKYLIILIFLSYVGCGNLYGQNSIPTELIKKSQTVNVDTIPPRFEIIGVIRDYFPYDEYYNPEENLLVLNAGWCDKFPEDFYKINLDNYFNIIDDSGSFTVTFKDSLLRSSLIRYYEAIDASGNKSNLEVRVTRSNTPGQISNLYVHINDTTLFFSPVDGSEKEIYLCDNTEVKIDAVPQLVCPDHSANYFWYINDKPIISERNSVLVFNLDSMNYETKTSVTVSESGSIDGRIKIIKFASELVKTIVQPSCSQSKDGSIQLDNVYDVVWAHNGSTSYYLENLDPGVYPVSYKCQRDCVFNDTITLLPKNILDFAVSDTIIDLTQNEILTVHNLSKGFDRFWWQIGDSIFTNILDEFDYKFNIPGKYVIKLTDNIGPCNDTIYKSIIVEESTSSNDYLYSSIKIGPNPFKDFINIDFAKSSDFNLKILGVDGRVYLTDQIIDARNFKVDLRFLNSGVYVLKITSPYENNPDKDFKIVKLTGD